MRKGETVVYELPENIQKKSLDSLSIYHRKDRLYCGSIKYNVLDKNGRMREMTDTEGAYSRIMVFDGNTNTWVVWSDPYKPPDDEHYGAKYAEKRPPTGPEVETLYDWAKQGDIKPLYVAITSIGDGPRSVVNYHGLEVNTFPETDNDKPRQEYIFTPGTAFVDRSEGRTEPAYGGGGRSRSYPESVPLGWSSGSERRADLPPECELGVDGSLTITVTSEFDFNRLEVAVGDTHSDGKLGWAKLSAELVSNNPGVITRTSLFAHQNVPPQGVVKGSPRFQTRVKPGDKIVIRSGGDTAYVMGVKIQ